MGRPSAEPRSFADGGYEILDDEIAAGKVTICSAAELKLRLGDHVLIESDGLSYDVEIVELIIFRDGWTAAALVVDAF